MHIVKKIFLPILALLVILAFVCFLFPKDQTHLASTVNHLSIPVKTAYVQQGNLPVFIRSVGLVTSPHSVEIRPQIDGELLELTVKQGQAVQKGTLLARIDDREIRAMLKQDKAELLNRQAQLNIALLDLKRYQHLKSQNAIPGQSLDQQQALVAQLQAQVQTQKAVIQKRDVELSHTQIKAPSNGIVGIVNIHQGNYIRTSDAQSLLSIMQVDPIEIEIGIPQKFLPPLLQLAAQNQLRQIQVFAFDNEEKNLLAQGQLELLDNQVSQQTGTIRARALFLNPQHRLWPGQTVVAKLQMQTLSDIMIVPENAVLQGNQTTYVWRIENDKAKMVEVQILAKNDNQIAVNGLQKADEVVIDGASRLREGSIIIRTPSENTSLQITAIKSLSPQKLETVMP